MKKIITSVLALGFSLAPALAFAEDTTGTVPPPPTKHVKQMLMEKKGEKLEERVDKKMENRVENGRAATTSMMRGDLKMKFDKITELRMKIKEGGNASTTRMQKEELNKESRLFMHEARQGAIATAATRVIAVSKRIGELAGKLSTRIDSAKAAGSDMTKASASLADITAKVASAEALAQSAIDLVKNASANATSTAPVNTQVFKDARAKVIEAQKALQGVRNDAEMIVKPLRELHKGSATTTPMTPPVSGSTTNQIPQ